ncbi:MAG: response regulator transcription factor [Deltaproteobacteria bacterium]|nr:response regulator transcription factor [Deltaproteobacteria bacterium]
MRILVVDDDRDTAEALAEGLALLGHEVVTAGGGRQALVFPLETFDAAIIDGNLGDLSGLDVAQQIRARGLTLRLLLCSGDPSFTREVALGAGFDAYTAKPCSLITLLALLRGESTGVFGVLS